MFISMTTGRSGRTPYRVTRVISLALSTVVMLQVLCVPVQAARRQGDRFGIRGGLWPQPHADGSLGRFLPADDPRKLDTTYALVSEPSVVTPFVELYGLFNLKRNLWAEVSVGWSTRTDVQVGGGLDPNSTEPAFLLGEGRIDFFPAFIGARAIRDMGSVARPHNIYGRAGLSMVFANESPSHVNRAKVGNLYTPGTEGAFGFLVGVGGEYYVAPKLGLLADVHYRYAKFNYARHAGFNMSAFWFGVGLTLRTR